MSFFFLFFFLLEDIVQMREMCNVCVPSVHVFCEFFDLLVIT